MKPLDYDKDLVKEYLTIYRKVNNIRHVLDCYSTAHLNVIKVEFIHNDFEYVCTNYMYKNDFEIMSRTL